MNDKYRSVSQSDDDWQASHARLQTHERREEASVGEGVRVRVEVSSSGGRARKRARSTRGAVLRRVTLGVLTGGRARALIETNSTVSSGIVLLHTRALGSLSGNGHL